MSNALAERLLQISEARIDSRRAEWTASLKHVPQPEEDLDYLWNYERGNLLSVAKARIESWADLVPPIYQAASLDALAPGQHPDDLRAYLEGPARNLWLAGPVGTGKTYAAYALAHQAVVDGLSAAVWSVPRLMVDMRPDGNPNAFYRACNTPLLVLDDIGAARPTDWALEQLFSIADERTSYSRRTILTTNQTYSQLVAIWGQPTLDRFRDRATTIEMTGDSRRGAAR